MQLSDILQNEKFKGADPDQQEEILNLYEEAVKEDSFQPNKFDMRSYLRAKQDVDTAKKALSLTPDPRSTFQRIKDEFVGGMESAAMAGTAVLAANGLLDPETAAARIAEDDKDAQARPVSRSMLKFQKASNRGWYGPILNIFSNPESAALIAAQGLGSSVPGLAAGAVGSFGTKVAGGGKELALAATMLGVGTSSAIVEGGSRFLDDLRKEAGGNLQDTEAVANILRDQTKVAALKDRALARGATVGAFDAASVALPANMLFKTARGLKGLAMEGIGDAAIQGMLGAAGEVAGNVAIGEQTDPADAWAEFIGEMVPGMIEVGIGGAKYIPQTVQAVKEKTGTAQFFPSQTSAPTIRTERQPGKFDNPRLSSSAISKESAKAEASNAPEVSGVLNPPPATVTKEKAGTEELLPEDEKDSKKVSEAQEKLGSKFVFLNNRFGPFSSIAENLARDTGMKLGGTKVMSPEASIEEQDALSDFDTNPDQDAAMKQNIDQADFAIVIGNNESLSKDPGQAAYRNYALDKQRREQIGRAHV